MTEKELAILDDCDSVALYQYSLPLAGMDGLFPNRFCSACLKKVKMINAFFVLDRGMHQILIFRDIRLL